MKSEIIYQGDHLPDGLIKSHKDGSRHDAVSDAVFLNLRQGLEPLYVDVVEAMSRTDSKFQLLSGFRGFGDAHETFLGH